MERRSLSCGCVSGGGDGSVSGRRRNSRGGGDVSGYIGSTVVVVEVEIVVVVVAEVVVAGLVATSGRVGFT